MTAATDADPTVLAGLPGVHDLAVHAGRVTFLVDDDAPGRRRAARSAALGVRSLTVAPPSLEELFLRHYGDELVAAGGARAVTAASAPPGGGRAATVRRVRCPAAVRGAARSACGWPCGCSRSAALTVYGAVVLDAHLPDRRRPAGAAAVQANPAAVLLSGPGYGLDDYTLGAMVTNEVALAVMVAAAIMSIQLVVRHTRAEEESGRAELVRAGVVGRRAALTAALLEAAVANAGIAVVHDGRARGYRASPSSIHWPWRPGSGLSGLVFGAVAAVNRAADRARPGGLGRGARRPGRGGAAPRRR